jgi:hypothetical protein
MTQGVLISCWTLLAELVSATNDRDKVYGILGLLPHPVSSKVNPDYHLTVNSVFTDFAKIWITVTDNLDSVFAWSSPFRRVPGPSWAPDWTTMFRRNHVQFPKRCHASGQSDPQYGFSDDSQSLICKGFRVDVIDGLSSNKMSGNDSNADTPDAPTGSEVVDPTFRTSRRRPF